MTAVYDPSTDTSFRGVAERMIAALGRTDATVGGVARTLVEAVAREMAVFYAMLEQAHKSGFLDTAEGPALDNVVAVLGVQRARAGRLVGRVELARATPAPQDIAVPAGRRVTGQTRAGAPLPMFETVADVVLARGSTRVFADVQEVLQDGGPPSPPALNPGDLTYMTRPVFGVESVHNPEPIRRAGVDESDEHLRARARSVLREGQRGTAQAIAEAVREQGVQQVEVRELEDGAPGQIRVLVGDPGFADDLAAQDRVLAAIRAAKAAGVRVRLEFLRSLPIGVQLRIEPADPDLDDRGFERLHADLAAALVKAVAGLPVGAMVNARKLAAALFSNPLVADVPRMTLTSRPPEPDPYAPRPGFSNGDLYVGPLETPVLVAGRVEVSRVRRAELRVDLVVLAEAARTSEAVRLAARNAVDNVAATHRAGAKILNLKAALTTALEAFQLGLVSATFTRDGAASTDSPTPVLPLTSEAIALGEVQVTFKEGAP